MITRARAVVVAVAAVSAVAPSSVSAQSNRGLSPLARETRASLPPALTLAEALRLAEAREPGLRATRAQAAGAHATASGAKSGLYPRVVGSATYQIASDPTPSAIGTEASDVLRGSLSASQLLWDFGRVGGRADAAAASADAADATARQSVVDVRLDVRARYVAVVAARAQLAVAKETLANEARHMEQIQAFVDVGQRPAIDLAQVKTTLATARLAAIRAENAVDTGLAELARAIGLDAPPTAIVDEWLAAVPGEDGEQGALLGDALRLRADLQALGHQRRAEESSLEAARAGYFPTLSLQAGADAYALTDLRSTLGWSVGLNLSWPLFEGFATPADVRGSRAALVAIDARVEGARQDVSLALERSRLAVRGAKAALGAADEAVTAARERYRLAEGRYAEGVGTIIELTDAQVGVTTVSSQHIQAELDLASARAQLLNLLGE